MTYHTGDETPVVHRNAGEDHDEPSLDTIDIAKQPGVTSDENSGATNRTEYCVPASYAPPPYVRTSAFDSWKFELAALLISIISFGAYVGVLIAYNGARLTDWNFPASLNTITAVLGTISRASLTFAISSSLGQQKWNWHRNKPDTLKTFECFDDASRGPYGSAKLLWWLRFKNWATLGAFVTIVCLAFDPFLQAIIHYTDGLITDSNITSAQTKRLTRVGIGDVDYGHVMAYTFNTSIAGSDGVTDLSVYLEVWNTTADIGWTTALLAGFEDYTSPANTALTSCETGNCTWRPFTSLAICSACNGISLHVKKAANSTYTPATTTYSLPQVYIDNPDTFAGYLDQYWNALSLNVTAYPWDTVSFQNYTTLLSSFAILQAGDSFIHGESRWNESSPIATECALYFCVNQYEIKVKGQELKETITPRLFERNTSSYQVEDGNTNSFGNLTKFQEASWPALWRREGALPASDLELMVAGEVGNFSISCTSIMSMVQYLLDWSIGLQPYHVFIGIDNAEELSAPLFVNIQRVQFNPGVNATADNTDDQHPLARILWDNFDQNHTTVSTAFDKAARSMSHYLRETGGKTEVVYGATQGWVTMFNMRWQFIVIPAFSLLAGCTYALLVIWETEKLGLPAWKESVLPTLVHGVSEETRLLLAAADRSRELDHASRATVVRFEEGKYGLYQLRATGDKT